MMRRFFAYLLLAVSIVLTACQPEKKNGPVTYSTAYNYVYNSEKLRSQGSNHGMRPSADGNQLSRPAIQSEREMNFLFLPAPAWETWKSSWLLAPSLRLTPLQPLRPLGE